MKAAVLAAGEAGFVLASARGVLATNPRPAVLIELTRTHSVYTATDATTPDHLRSLEVALRAAQLTPHADATPQELAALLDATPAQWAIETTTQEDRLWRHRARVGIRADLPVIEGELRRLTKARDRLVSELGVDITRRNGETVAWLQARGVDAALETRESGFSEIRIPASADIELLATAYPELAHWPEARSISRDFLAFGPLARHGRTGRFHPEILTNEARTGRMAVRTPALQGVRADVRRVMRAEPGHALVSADYANAELRVAAAMIGDADFTRAVTEGDVYARLGEHVGMPRKVAGVVLLATLYGQSQDTLARKRGVEAAAAIHAAISAELPALEPWTAHVRAEARRGHRFETLYGRPLPLTTGAIAYKAPNLLIQGTARDAFGEGVRAVADELGTETLWLPVHDELVVQVPEADVQRACDVLRERFAVTLPDGIRLPASPVVLGATFAKPAA